LSKKDDFRLLTDNDGRKQKRNVHVDEFGDVKKRSLVNLEEAEWILILELVE